VCKGVYFYIRSPLFSFCFFENRSNPNSDAHLPQTDNIYSISSRRNLKDLKPIPRDDAVSDECLFFHLDEYFVVVPRSMPPTKP
jgi:hypothetical protein